MTAAAFPIGSATADGAHNYEGVSEFATNLGRGPSKMLSRNVSQYVRGATTRCPFAFR